MDCWPTREVGRLISQYSIANNIYWILNVSSSRVPTPSQLTRTWNELEMLYEGSFD